MSTSVPSSSASLRLVEPDEEHELQGHALALESHNLRRRAERYCATLECGGEVDPAELAAVRRAFRAYRPFVFRRDRALNDAAARALVDAMAGLSMPDASVA